ncbi:6766_t:CDS:1, partial [Cetraspora pellucida]
MQSHISPEMGEITIDNVESESSQIPPGFTRPDMKTHDYRWTGFWRSLEKGTGNRYTAKCIHCNFELPGRPERLHTHVLTCSNWPVSEKNCYIKKATNSTSNARKKTKVSVSHQEKSLTSDQESLA